VPTEVDAGSGGTVGTTLASATQGPVGILGGLLLAAGAALLAAGGIAGLRRRGRHSV
jgi:hypothetical protein